MQTGLPTPAESGEVGQAGLQERLGTGSRVSVVLPDGIMARHYTRGVSEQSSVSIGTAMRAGAQQPVNAPETSPFLFGKKSDVLEIVSNCGFFLGR
jgi:hypothetical protein